jgi:hypothetical protein
MSLIFKNTFFIIELIFKIQEEKNLILNRRRFSVGVKRLF